MKTLNIFTAITGTGASSMNIFPARIVLSRVFMYNITKQARAYGA
jgi:hypothetical protein